MNATRGTRAFHAGRTMRVAFGSALLAVGAIPAAGEAQLAGPPPRPLPRAAAVTTEPLLSTTQVRALPGGRVLLNDVTRRRLMLFDSTLTNFTVIADSAAGAASPYGTGIGTLVAYRGDSSLLMETTSLSMLVIDGEGRIVRVRAIPRSQDATRISNIYTGMDADGRLVYRGLVNMIFPSAPPGGGVAVPEQPDSLPLLRIDLATRRLDTAAMLKTPKSTMSVTQTPTGGFRINQRINPLPTLDEFAVTSDGRVALVRGRDYHVDWLNPDGTITSSPKLPFDWQRLDEDRKAAFLDSVKVAREKQREQSIKMMIARYDSLMEVSRKTGGPQPDPLPSMNDYYPPTNMVDPEELPDYRPPFTSGAVRADADGNIWIRTAPMKPTPGGPVYDVVNGKGELIDRIQIQPQRTLVGFGPGGIVYVGTRDAKGVHLERVRLSDPPPEPPTVRMPTPGGRPPGARPDSTAQPGTPPVGSPAPGSAPVPATGSPPPSGAPPTAPTGRPPTAGPPPGGSPPGGGPPPTPPASPPPGILLPDR